MPDASTVEWLKGLSPWFVMGLGIIWLLIKLSDNTKITEAVAVKISGGTHADVVAAIAEVKTSMATREAQLAIDGKVDGIYSRLSRLENDTESRFKDLESKIELKACQNSPSCPQRNPL